MMKTKTKILLVAVALFAAMGIGITLTGQPIPQPYEANVVSSEMKTPATGWILLRTPAAADWTAAYTLTTEDMSWGTKVASQTTLTATNGMIDVLGEIGPNTNLVEIAFFASDTDVADDDFDISIWAWKDSPYGPGIPVYLTTGDACKVGSMACLKHPTLGTAQAAGLWVDTLSGTDCWGGCTILDSGNNHIARIRFDLQGYRYLLVRVWNDGGATAAAKIGAVITGL